MPRLDKRVFIPPYFVTFLSYVPLQPRQHWANSWLLTDLQLLSTPTYCLGWVSKSEDKSTFYPRYVWVNSPRWRCKCGCEVHPEGWAAVPPRKSFFKSSVLNLGCKTRSPAADISSKFQCWVMISSTGVNVCFPSTAVRLFAAVSSKGFDRYLASLPCCRWLSFDFVFLFFWGQWF